MLWFKKKTSIKTCAGIGDILHTKAQLDQIRDDYDRISIGYDDSLVSRFRSDDDQYRIFLDGLFKLLFSEQPYHRDQHIKAQCKNPEALWESGFQPIVPDLSHLLALRTSIPDEPYIVISTKIRGIKRAQYEELRPDFLNVLRLLSKKSIVVLLGERTIGYNAEYKCHGSELIYSIYTDVLSATQDGKLLDLTVPELGLTAPSLIRFRNECFIQQKALRVITIGSGGNVSIAMSVGKIIGFYAHSEMERFFTVMLQNTKNRRVCLLRDKQEFLGSILSLA